ncbi:MAG: Hpt domain-containing protein, partial [Pseudomonadota bacterium]|nr:Hpt domain-containing protein [Pseudomonadota bacterium]
MEEIVAVFIQEAREQLREMEQGLMALQGGADVAQADPEQINAIFRAAHTIKGGAGVVEIQVIEGFTHAAENALDKVRNGQLALDAELIDDLLAAADHLGALLDAIEQGENGDDAGLTARGAAIAAHLKARLGGLPASQAGAAASAAAIVTDTAIVPSAAGTGALTDTWHVSLRFGRDLLKNGMDPLAFLRYLGSLGEIVHLSTLFDDMPAAADMDPECCYLGFEIRFRGQTDHAAIEQVFDFVRDDCLLRILPPHSPLADYRALLDALPEGHGRLGDILVEAGTLSKEELAQVLTAGGPES